MVWGLFKSRGLLSFRCLLQYRQFPKKKKIVSWKGERNPGGFLENGVNETPVYIKMCIYKTGTPKES